MRRALGGWHLFLFLQVTSVNLKYLTLLALSGFVALEIFAISPGHVAAPQQSTEKNHRPVAALSVWGSYVRLHI
jgi:hypothetical protein